MTADIEVLDAPAKLVELSPVAKQLAELKKDLYGVQFDVSTTAGDKAARAARSKCVTIRTGAAKVYADWNAPMLEKQRGMRALVAQITEEVSKIEGPIDEQIKAEEARKAEIKAAKEAVELERQQAIQSRINALAAYPMQAVGKGSEEVAAILANVAELPITIELYEHRAGEAMELHGEVAGKLEEMHTAALAHEQEQAQVEAQRIENERVRAEQEAAAARERAEQERIRAEQEEAARVARQAEAERLRTEREAFEQERAAEQARQDEARAEQLAREEAIAAAQREREARFAREREEFEEHQRAVLRAEEEKAEAAARLVQEQENAARAQAQAEADAAAAEAARREREDFAANGPGDVEIVRVLAKHYQVTVGDVMCWISHFDYVGTDEFLASHNT